MRGSGVAVFLVLSAFYLGCGDDDDSGGSVGPNSGVVGGSCSDNGDCKERCVGGNDYPGGMCTVSCGSDHDCPGGSACVDDAGGICAPLCGSNADCDAFGGGWACRDRDRRGAPGEVAVCRGD